MSRRGYCWCLITTSLTIMSVFVVATEDSQKPKELLRHQQSHRPLFIDRRLTMQDIKLPDLRQSTIDIRRNQQDNKGSRDLERSSDDEETTIEKPQIRHGRSRGHFTRSKALDAVQVLPNYESLTMSSSSPSYQFTNSNSNDVDEIVIDDDIEPTYLKLLGSSINNTMYLDFDDQSLVNLSSSTLTTHSDQHHPQPRMFGQVVQVEGPRRSDSFKQLYKAAATKRLMDNNDESNDNVSRTLETFGVVVRTLPDDHKTIYNYDDIVVEKNSMDDYGYDEQIMSNWTNDSHTDDNDFREDFITSEVTRKPEKQSVQVDIVTRFLRIIENQHLLGENCTAGTDLNLGEGVVDQYAQERFRLEANFAVNRANMLTRLWKYSPEVMLSSEYLLHASVLSMVEFDEDIFAAGNCYDKMQYRDRWLYCPFAHRLQDQDGVLVKDLAVEYKYLSNSSEWFYIARKNAERVIANNNQFSRGKLIYCSIRIYYIRDFIFV